MENKKSGLITGIIIGFLIAVIAGLAVYIVLDKKDSDKSTDDKKQTSETKKEEKKENKEENKEEKKDDKKEEVKDLSNQTFDLANFDETKIINKASDTIKYIKDGVVETSTSLNSVHPEVMVSTNQDVKVRINWNDLCYLGGESKEFPYAVNVGYDIRNVYVGGWGQGAGNNTLFYLLKDGTVAYTPITSDVAPTYVNDPSIKTLNSEGKIEGVEDVVMLATVQVGFTNAAAGGYATTIAIKADGTFYDLREILLNTGKYSK